MFENGDQGSAQNFDAVLMSRMVWPGGQFVFGKIVVKHLFVDFEINRFGPSTRDGNLDVQQKVVEQLIMDVETLMWIFWRKIWTVKCKNSF